MHARNKGRKKWDVTVSRKIRDECWPRNIDIELVETKGTKTRWFCLINCRIQTVENVIDDGLFIFSSQNILCGIFKFVEMGKGFSKMQYKG
jgi:hypothetical protein